MTRICAQPACRAVPPPRYETPLVPRNSISGRALDRRRRHHDLPGLAHHRRGHSGRRLGAANGRRTSRAKSPSRSCRRPGRDLDAGCRAGGRPSRATSPASARCGPTARRNPASCSSPGSAPGLTLDESAGAAPDRGQDRARRGARHLPQLRKHARASRCRAPCSTTIAAGSTACARWPARAVGGRRRHPRPDDRGHHAVRHLRHARRHGGQQDGDRGAAFRRRQERLHRRPFPAPFPAARPARRRDRRRRGDRAVRARRAC